MNYYQAPNRYILAISGLLVVFAISIGVAIIFPYQDDVGAVESDAEETTVFESEPKGVNKNEETSAAAEPVYEDEEPSTGGSKESPHHNVNEETADDPNNTSGSELKDETKNEKTSADAEIAFEEEKLSEGESAKAQQSDIHQQGLFHHSSKETHTVEEDMICRTLLLQADVNSNQMIDTTEYLSFLHDLQSSNILHADNLPEIYSDLDFPLRINFLQQSCICPFDMPDCCDERNGIYIGNDDVADNVCTFTMNVGMEGNIEKSIGENAKGLRGATR